MPVEEKALAESTARRNRLLRSRNLQARNWPHKRSDTKGDEERNGDGLGVVVPRALGVHEGEAAPDQQ